MHSMKNILALTDFSDAAYQALFYIAHLMEHREAHFVLLNAYTEATPIHSPAFEREGTKSPADQLMDEAQEGLNHVLHKIRLDQQNPHHTFSLMALKDLLMNAIDHVLDAREIDLLVMGNKGVSGVKGVFTGSQATRVIRTGFSKAVLLVPEGAPEEKPFEMAFATDFNHPYDPAGIEPLLRLAKLCSAVIRILHINAEEHLGDHQLENLTQLKGLLGNMAPTIHWIPDFRTKSTAIQAYIEKHKIGLLAMVHSRHGFFDRLTREDVIENMSFMIEVPFLILPESS